MEIKIASYHTPHQAALPYNKIGADNSFSHNTTRNSAF